MLGNFSEQFKKSTQPASTLLEMNVKALNEIASQQTEFFAGVIADSKKLVESVASQTELKGIYAAQSVYAESLRERFTSTSKSTYNTLTQSRLEMTDLLKKSLETVKTSEPKTSKKTSTKVKARPKPAPVVEAQQVAVDEAKVAPKKTSVKKPAVKKATVTKKAPVKAAPKPQATPPVQPKAKVAQLKAEEVKAVSKKD